MPSLSLFKKFLKWFKRSSKGRAKPTETPEPTETGEMTSTGVEPGIETAVKAERPAAARPPMPEYRFFPGMRPIHLLAVNYEHHSGGLGEDAEPLCYFAPPANGLLGVFDGLGGAGGGTIRLPNGSERTGAWLASRRVSKTVLAVSRDLMCRTPMLSASSDSGSCEQLTETSAPWWHVDFTATLKRAIQEELVSYAAQLGARTDGPLKSRLIRTLPTTMALCLFDLDSNEFTAIWAGDSRVYCLRPDIGLRQVTTDHLKSNADAMANLTQDSPMSNYVSASTDFVLDEHKFELDERSILLAASDGCFGYVRTPLHFEYLLLRTLQQARDMADWQYQLHDEIKRVTSDDATLSVAVIGWPDFVSCRRDFKPRYEWCKKKIIAYNAWNGQVESAQQKLDQAREALDQAREALAAHTRDLWEEYRQTYEIPNSRRAEVAPGPAIVDGPPDEGGGEDADLPDGDGTR